MTRLPLVLEGFILFRRDVTILKDATTGIHARLLPSDEFIASYQKQVARWRSAAWVSSGMGAAGVVASLVTFIVGSTRASELNADKKRYNEQPVRPQPEYKELQRRERQLGTLDSVTLTTALVGLVGAAAGVALFTMGPDPSRYISTPNSEPQQASESKSQAQVLLTWVGVLLVTSF